MPYKLRKAPKRDLYWVVAEDGKHMSKDPIPKERAKAQMRALYASERTGGVSIPKDEFIKEHVNLIDVLKHGPASARETEAMDQTKELKRIVGGAIKDIIPRVEALRREMEAKYRLLGGSFPYLVRDICQGVLDENPYYDFYKVRKDNQKGILRGNRYETRIKNGIESKVVINGIERDIKLQPVAFPDIVIEDAYIAMIKPIIIEYLDELQTIIQKSLASGASQAFIQEHLRRIGPRPPTRKKPVEKRLGLGYKGGAARIPDHELAFMNPEEIAMGVVDQAEYDELMARWNDLHEVRDREMAQRLAEEDRQQRREARRQEAIRRAEVQERLARQDEKLRKKHQKRKHKDKGHKSKQEFRGRGLKVGAEDVTNDFLQQMVKESYVNNPKHDIDGFKLVHSTPTLKFYNKGGVMVVAIRGTQLNDMRDIKADALAVIGKARTSQRYHDDVAVLRQMKAKYPNDTFVAVGHSLGGAILDLFLRDGLITQGQSYNGFPEPHERRVNPLHHRIYHKNDFIYRLFASGIPNIEVRTTKDPFWKNILHSSLPTGLDAVYSGVDSHLLNKFEGGNY